MISRADDDDIIALRINPFDQAEGGRKTVPSGLQPISNRSWRGEQHVRGSGGRRTRSFFEGVIRRACHPSRYYRLF